MYKMFMVIHSIVEGNDQDYFDTNDTKEMHRYLDASSRMTQMLAANFQDELKTDESSVYSKNRSESSQGDS